MSGQQKDNSTLREKVLLRRELLRHIPDPCVLETHGGYGVIFERCYSHLGGGGVVFETNPEKTAHLARQRPTWAVYEADCLIALQGGIGSHLPINFLDIDPYGDPWPVIYAFFENWPEFPPVLGLAVQDGLRQKLMMGGGWSVKSISDLVFRHGNAALFRRYKDLCKELLTEVAGRAGYRLNKWTAYYCGHNSNNTHYAALLVKP